MYTVKENPKALQKCSNFSELIANLKKPEDANKSSIFSGISEEEDSQFTKHIESLFLEKM